MAGGRASIRRDGASKALLVLLTLLLAFGLVAGATIAAPRDKDRKDDGDNGGTQDNGGQPTVVADVNGAGMDRDADADYIPDYIDNCPQTPNAEQTDSDGNGVGDLCEPVPDADADTIPDSVDNCPGIANPGQNDNDGDGAGNACDKTPDGEPPPTEAAAAVTPLPAAGAGATATPDDGVVIVPAPGAVVPPAVAIASNAGASGTGPEAESGRPAGTEVEGDEAPPLPPPPALRPFVPVEPVEPTPAAFEVIARIDAGALPPDAEQAAPPSRAAETAPVPGVVPGDGGDPEPLDAGAAPGWSGIVPYQQVDGALRSTAAAGDRAAAAGAGLPVPVEADAVIERPDLHGVAGDPGDSPPADEPENLDGGDPGDGGAAPPAGARADADDPGDGDGGTAQETIDGSANPDWLPDEDFQGGLARTRPAVSAIAGTDDDELYLTQRRGDARGRPGEFSYAIPVPAPGTYRVRLHFAEIYWGATGGAPGGPGKRVFSVDAEGAPELVDYDIYDDVGPMTAVVKQFDVDVEDGVLDLRFYATRDQPTVAAIEVLGQPTGERWVDVDKSTRTVRLMVGGTTVAAYRASMGEGPEDDFHDTMPGTYQIQSKVADLTPAPYADGYFMYWAGFDPARENGFHSWLMNAQGQVVPGGDGPTWGCVATAPDDAAQIYAFVDIGTRVEVHW